MKTNEEIIKEYEASNLMLWEQIIEIKKELDDAKDVLMFYALCDYKFTYGDEKHIALDRGKKARTYLRMK